jgi:hypothetical protein
MYEVNEHGVPKKMAVWNSKDSALTFYDPSKLSKRKRQNRSDSKLEPKVQLINKVLRFSDSSESRLRHNIERQNYEEKKNSDEESLISGSASSSVKSASSPKQSSSSGTKVKNKRKKVNAEDKII